ncbi:Gfo/Idh/MocA family protein [Catenulispora pinisilvae]|uniref:Gfo/Idh/MocA family protein n=1 Tax=Catenulispora pinisilvae TaxID=2705253 RepID=UPI0018911BF4|nr:Gfo/Idh/MocA family oxidoreductase [Catenulispora pinisilvae]
MAVVPVAVVRVAVVGLGHVARHVHLPLLADLNQHFRITALCDSVPGYAADLAHRLGIAESGVFTDAQSMFERGEFDAVLLLTSGSHAALAAEALKRGYAVFCEKPLAHTPEEAALVAGAGAGARAGERLMLGYMKQYGPNVAEAIDSLDPATVRHIDISVLHPPEDFPPIDWTPVAAPPPTHLGARAHWEYRAMLDSVCHDVALIRLLAGVAELDVDSAASWGARGEEPGSLEFSGPLPHGRYSVRWHFLPDYLDYEESVHVQTETDTHYLTFGNPYFFSAKSSFERELLAFHALVTAGTAPLSGIAEGTADIRTALNVLRALGGAT